MNPGGAPADPLAALRPIHSPPPVSWWPPAPGWWILALTLCLLIALSVWWFRKRRMRRAVLRELHELENNAALSDREFAAAVSILLKRYLAWCSPGQHALSLSGRPWLQFLEESSGLSGFVSGPGSVLGNEVYRQECRVRRDDLAGLAREWIRKVRCDRGRSMVGS